MPDGKRQHTSLAGEEKFRRLTNSQLAAYLVLAAATFCLVHCNTARLHGVPTDMQRRKANILAALCYKMILSTK
jgi:hypothetical protein